MAHAQYAGNVGHRQAVLVRPADGLVSVGPELLAKVREAGVAAAVFLGESPQAGVGIRCMAFGASDAMDGLTYSCKSVCINGAV